jgi:hypothetical protein
MRTGLALFLLLAVTGAVPPIPPEHPPAAQSAPIPNPDARAPLDTSSAGTQVGFTDFRLDRDNQSMGYSPGSQFQTNEDRRPIQTPGLTVRVPLQ